MSYQLLLGDALTVLKTLPANSVQCCVTSPPYYGLRDYGTATWEGGEAECDHVADAAKTKKFGNPEFNVNRPSREATKIDGYYFKDTCGKCGARRVDQQIGIEATPEQYVANLVSVFREVRRVLRDDATLWLNLGDSYNGSGGAGGDYGPGGLKEGQPKYPGRNVNGLGPKQLLGMPWRTAFALQADGWILRSEVIWHKKAPMPESVTDRPTKAHEQVFLLAKSASYYYDHVAIKEDAVGEYNHVKRNHNSMNGKDGVTQRGGKESSALGLGWDSARGRNKRSVWTLGPEQFAGAHYATMPSKLVEPCILAGTSAHGCCAACGAPWERTTEKYTTFEGGSGKAGRSAADANANGKWAGKQYGENIKLGPVSHVTTTGWQPTCTCNADPVPCVVLDPFFGSGTTAAVALKHHRSFVGIDLDSRNIDLAHDRIGRSQPLLLQVTT